MKSLFRRRSGHLLWLLFNLVHQLSTVLLFRSAQWLDTHLSRLPCSGQLCLGPKSPLSLFSGKKGSLGIPAGVTQETTIRVKSVTWKKKDFFQQKQDFLQASWQEIRKTNTNVQKIEHPAFYPSLLPLNTTNISDSAISIQLPPNDARWV